MATKRRRNRGAYRACVKRCTRLKPRLKAAKRRRRKAGGAKTRGGGRRLKQQRGLRRRRRLSRWVTRDVVSARLRKRLYDPRSYRSKKVAGDRILLFACRRGAWGRLGRRGRCRRGKFDLVAIRYLRGTKHRRLPKLVEVKLKRYGAGRRRGVVAA